MRDQSLTQTHPRRSSALLPATTHAYRRDGDASIGLHRSPNTSRCPSWSHQVSRNRVKSRIAVRDAANRFKTPSTFRASPRHQCGMNIQTCVRRAVCRIVSDKSDRSPQPLHYRLRCRAGRHQSCPLRRHSSTFQVAQSFLSPFCPGHNEYIYCPVSRGNPARGLHWACWKS
jgi:hypothetical protein